MRHLWQLHLDKHLNLDLYSIIWIQFWFTTTIFNENISHSNSNKCKRPHINTDHIAIKILSARKIGKWDRDKMNKMRKIVNLLQEEKTGRRCQCLSHVTESTALHTPKHMCFKRISFGIYVLKIETKANIIHGNMFDFLITFCVCGCLHLFSLFRLVVSTWCGSFRLCICFSYRQGFLISLVPVVVRTFYAYDDNNFLHCKHFCWIFTDTHTHMRLDRKTDDAGTFLSVQILELSFILYGICFFYFLCFCVIGSFYGIWFALFPHTFFFRIL